MTADSIPTAHIRGIPDLLGVIPHLLGFHPTESVVFIVIDQTRVELTARADLAELQPAGHIELLVDRLLVRWPAARVWVVAYSRSEQVGWRVLRRAAAHLAHAVAGEPICVSGRWYRVGDIDAPRHAHDPASSQSAASATVHGLQARPSRSVLRRSVQIDPDQAYEAECAWLAATERLQNLASDARPAAMVTALRAGLSNPARLTRDELVWLATLCLDPDARDRALIAITHDNAEACVELWVLVVRACPMGLQGHALALVGWAGWVSGNGALQCVCLEELDAIQASLPLQRMLNDLNQAIVPPSFWTELRAKLAAALTPLDESQMGADEAAGGIGEPHGECADDQVA